MIDAAGYAVLQGIVKRESRSLLQYVHDSFPWTPPGERPALDDVRRYAVEQQAGIASLARWLARRRYPVPLLGPYPGWFTTINYVSLDYLLPLLVDEEQKRIAQLERDGAALGDPDAAALIQALIQTKRQHLQRLEDLAAQHPAPALSRGA